jgi:dolichol kinase
MTVPGKGRRGGTLDFRAEVVRKVIHLSSLSIPITYQHVPKGTMLILLVPITIVSLVIDLGRHWSRPLAHWFDRWFGWLLREHERDHERMLLSGATYVFLSAVICITLFPRVIVVTAFTILIISDTAAALVGHRFGRHRFFQKSIEGTAGFIASAFIVIALTPKATGAPFEYVIACIAAVIGGVVEAASIELRLDDNLSIPLSIGASLWGLYALTAQLNPANELVYRALLSLG